MIEKHLNKNVIAFHYGMVVVEPIGVDNRELATVVNADLMKYGYILTKEAFEVLSTASDKDIIQWADNVIGYLSDALDKDQHETLYKGFPDTVKNRDNFQILVEQIMHYWTGGALQFDEDIKREYHFEHVDYKKIKAGTEEEFLAIPKRLLQVNSVMSPQDFSIVKWFLTEYKKYTLPEDIPFKENLCMVAGTGVKDLPVKTATDVLRIAAYLSHGHSDLIVPPKMIRESAWASPVPNPERKARHFNLTEEQKEYIVSLLEKLAGDSGKALPYYAAEMKERHKQWNKLAHHIHPGRFAEKYPRAVAALRAMNSSTEEFKKIRTFNSLVENAATFKGKLKLLRQRPGMLARSLNALIIHYHKKFDKIMDALVEVADKISNKVLFELWTYFEARTKEMPRKVKPKGARRPVSLPALPAMPEEQVEAVKEAIWRALRRKAEKKEPMGKVWVDPELKKIPLPTDLRNMTEQMRPVITGQRNPLGVEKRYLNLFCAWEGSTDLDFTVSILNKDGSVEKVGYGGTGFKTRDNSILHSGDNTGNYQYNSEIVSIDLQKTNAKYLLAMVNVFSGTMADNNTKIGFEERDKVFKSNIYRPETTAHTMFFNSQARRTNLFIIDVETKEWIMVDEDGANTAVANIDSINEYIKQISELPNPSVYDLLMMHAETRGELVDDEHVEEADVVFKFEDFSHDYVKTLEFMLD